MALLLDETTWDLARPIRKATAAEQIRQSVAIRLKTRRGEWAFDVEQGLPYTESMLVRSPDLALVESLVRAEIALVPGVTGVQRVEVTYDRTLRTMAIEVDATTDEGLVSVTL